MHDISLDEISKRITDAVLAQPYINRDNLQTLIRPILKVWLKSTDEFKSQKANKTKLQFTIENREVQQKFWLSKVRELVGNENMQPFYDELDYILIEQGYKSKN